MTKGYWLIEFDVVDTVWAGYWGLFYRKFFWDFVNGTLRDPGGFQYVVTLSPFLNYL